MQLNPSACLWSKIQPQWKPLKPPTPSAPSEVSQKRMQLGKWVSLQAFEGAILNRFEVKGSIGFQLGEGLPPHMFGHSCW